MTLLDFDNDGWPDIFVANDTQPNKLYQNLRNGKFQEVGVRAGVAFSEDGKARAGMGVDVADLDNTGIPTLAVTNFHNEMLALYKGRHRRIVSDLAPGSEIGRVTRGSLGFGCFFFDANLDGSQDLLVVNGHIDNTIRNTQYAQPPHLFLNNGGSFRDVAAEVGSGFVLPKVGRGAAFGDFDNDGDLDVLVTTNGGPAYLYRNDQLAGNRSLRIRLVGTESNRDGIGSSVRIYYGDRSTTKTVKSGGSDPDPNRNCLSRSGSVHETRSIASSSAGLADARKNSATSVQDAIRSSREKGSRKKGCDGHCSDLKLQLPTFSNHRANIFIRVHVVRKAEVLTVPVESAGNTERNGRQRKPLGERRSDAEVRARSVAALACANPVEHVTGRSRQHLRRKLVLPPSC